MGIFSQSMLNRAVSEKLAISVNRRAVRLALVAMGLMSAILASCAPANANMVAGPVMAKVKRLAIGAYRATDHIVLLGLKTDTPNLTFGASSITSIKQEDARLVTTRLGARGGFPSLDALDNSFFNNNAYANALSNPGQASPQILAEICGRANSDGLLWLEREYRIRATQSVLGDSQTEWTGEIRSQMRVYDKSGQPALMVTWVDETTAKKYGATLSTQDLGDLLTSALDQSANTTVQILARATSAGGLPDGLHDERSAIQQGIEDLGADAGILLRGGLLILMVAAGLNMLFGERHIGVRALGLLALGVVIYLLIGRGWWKDTVLAILKAIELVLSD